MKGQEIWSRINKNEKLKKLELQGFRRGDRRGKTMDVSLREVFATLSRQMQELRDAYYLGHNTGILMRRIADVRNAAGCLFLKVDPEETAKDG